MYTGGNSKAQIDAISCLQLLSIVRAAVLPTYEKKLFRKESWQ